MQRVCGASEERDSLSAARCWCGAMFCGPGGFKQSRAWRRDFSGHTIAVGYGDWIEQMNQPDFFAGVERRAKWLLRHSAHAQARAGRKRR